MALVEYAALTIITNNLTSNPAENDKKNTICS